MKYVLDSSNIDGQLVFEYDENNMLVGFENNAKLESNLVDYLATHFPMKFEMLQWIVKVSKNAKLLELPDEVTFEKFYNTYCRKEGKIKALAAWNKLSENDRKLAYRYIPRYNSILAMEKWRSRLMPATYLNERKWLD